MSLPWSSVQTPCPLVRAWSGMASSGLGEQRRPSPQWAVWTPQDAPFSRAQAMQQPHPGSLSTCLQSTGMAGQSLSLSCEQGAQRMGSGPTTGDDLTTAKTARATAATKISFSYNPGISSLQTNILFGLVLPLDLLSLTVLFFLNWFPRTSSRSIYVDLWPPEALMIDRYKMCFYKAASSGGWPCLTCVAPGSQGL